MKTVATAIEDHLVDAGRLGALGNQLADLAGRLDAAAVLDTAAQFLVHGRGGGQGPALTVVDDLGVHVLAGAEHRKADPSPGPNR